MNGIKRGFNNDGSSKRKAWENVGLLLDGAGTLVTESTERAKVLHAFFLSEFTGKANLQESQASKTRGKMHSKTSGDALMSAEEAG